MVFLMSGLNQLAILVVLFGGIFLIGSLEDSYTRLQERAYTAEEACHQ